METFEKVAELEQEGRELSHLIGLNMGDVQAARADIKPTRDAALAGVPGKQSELVTLEARIAELEAAGGRLEARRMEITLELGEMSQRDTIASSLARDFGLSDEQRVALKEALESGKSAADVRAMAGQLRGENDKAAMQAKSQGREYSFQGADEVAW
jgi:hypothetical protein